MSRLQGKDFSHLFANRDRFCNQHQGKAPEEGGKWITTNNGRSRRWICAMCLEARQARQEAARVSV